MQRLRIDIFFSTPLVMGSHPIHLDDVLTHQAALELRGNLGLDAYPDEMIEIALPIEKRQNAYYACSIGILDDQVIYDRAFYTKKWEGEIDGQFVVDSDVKFKPNVSIGGGWSKAYQNELQIVTANRMVFYATGDLSEIKRLLSQITHLGKKRSQGYGKIHRMDISPTDQDPVWMNQNREQVPLRNVPIEALSEQELAAHRSRIGFTGFQAPYRDLSQYVLCITPPISLWQPKEQVKAVEMNKESDEEWLGIMD